MLIRGTLARLPTSLGGAHLPFGFGPADKWSISSPMPAAPWLLQPGDARVARDRTGIHIACPAAGGAGRTRGACAAGGDYRKIPACGSVMRLSLGHGASPWL